MLLNDLEHISVCLYYTYKYPNMKIITVFNQIFCNIWCSVPVINNRNIKSH